MSTQISLPAAIAPCLSVQEAILSRRSVRAFLPAVVLHNVLAQVLELAARAPSGSNIQPWQVMVLTGAPLRQLGQELEALSLAGDPGNEEPPKPYHRREPYRSRRRKVGWDLYGALGISREESERMAQQMARNYVFFDAPMGLFFTIDADFDAGRWLDYGMFLQNMMLAARAMGLDTCAQQAFLKYETVIARRLGLENNRKLVCGMALGYANPLAAENTFIAERSALQTFVHFVDSLN
ncbi:nitroreductase [Pseudomonas syringae]|uniref:Nitroreductase n=1 Tax=Pseudomonas syringae TaxID=317 RepID=A0A085V8J7_PSESX|nr:nitroreductase [Pseudomonas syringae]KFE51760.1 nitroreductase [Pseudomonas syringae]